ncbi:condensation domain-containing protein [Streptomyces sp. NPDC048718]|uniref:condensation domain-containing protein n=1 Tax=Streptomyces sp. NPDC048718 TaxID=3365587 RepID=UPI003711A268
MTVLTGDRAAGLPPTAAQQVLWAEEQVAELGSNSGYLAVTITGSVTERELRAAAEAVLHRHEPVRTVLRLVDGVLRGFVLPAAELLRFRTAALPCSPGEERKSVRAWMARHEAPRRWDLAEEGCLQFLLLDHGGGRRTLAMPAHHAGFDGRSKFLVAADFTRFLSSVRAGEPLDREVLSEAEAPEAAEDVCAEAVAHWTGAMADIREPMALPGTVTGRQGPVAGTRMVDIDPAHVAGLRDLAERQGVSTFTTLVAALGLQLARYGNRRSVLGIAADVSDTRTARVASAQINVVPMLLETDPDASGETLVAEAAAALGRVRRYRRVPFQQLVKALPSGSAARLMTQVGVSFPRPPRGLRLEVPGLALDWDFFTPNRASTFERTLQIRADWPNCRVRLDYRVENTGEHEAAAFNEHFCRAVEALVERTGSNGRALRLPLTYDRSAEPADGRAALTALLGRLAAERPAAAALRGERWRLTFAELVPLLRSATASDHGETAEVLAALREVLTGPVSGADALWAAADLAVPAGPGEGTATAAYLPAPVPVLAVEAVAAWRRGAALELLRDPAAEPGERVARLYGPLAVLRELAGRRLSPGPSGEPDALVVPLDQLCPAAELLDWTASGRVLQAPCLAAGQVVGWAGLGARPFDPPRITAVPGLRLEVRSEDGEPLPEGVPGRITAVVNGMERPVTDGRHGAGQGRVTAEGRIDYLGADGRRWLSHHGLIDVPLVERVLYGLPGVHEAAVVLRETRRGSAAVLVVAVADAVEPVDAGTIRAALRERLPGQDLPGRIEITRVLPRDDHGSVDTVALGAAGSREYGKS